MTAFLVEVEYKTKNWDTLTINATDIEEGEQFAVESILEGVEDVSDVVVTSIKEIKELN